MKLKINHIIAIIVLICITWIVARNITPLNNKEVIHICHSDTLHTPIIQNKEHETNNTFHIETLLVTLLGSGGIGYLIIKWFLYDRKTKQTENSINETLLCSHPIFSVIQEILARDIKNINFDSEGRTEIFRTMVAEQCLAYENNIRKFINEEKNFTSTGDFRNKARMMVIRAINDYEKRWKELNIPDIVIEKYKEWHSGRLEVLLNEIDTISLYRHSKSYEQTTYEVLLSISALLKFGVTNDSMRALEELNGELNGLVFNGKII